MPFRPLLASAFALLVAAGCSSGGSDRAASAPDSTSATTVAEAKTSTSVSGDSTPGDTKTTPATKAKPKLRKLRGGITAVGDSLMIDTAPSLRNAIPGIDIDAAVDRSAIPGPMLLIQRLVTHHLGPDIVFDLGLNGGFTKNTLDRIVGIAGGRRIVLVTNRCPHCSWTAGQNAIMRKECTHERRCYLADWEALANKHPEWFAADGVHMAIGGTGAHAYAQLVRDQLTAP